MMDNYSNGERTPTPIKKKGFTVTWLVLLIVAAVFAYTFLTQFKPYSRDRSIDVSNIKEINIDAGSAHVEAVTGTSDELVIRINGRVNYDPGFEEDNRDNVLQIRFNRGLRFGLSFSDLRMTVEVPASYKRNITLSSASGSVALDLSELDKVKLHTSSGSVSVESLYCNSLSIDVSSGSITTDDITARKDFSIKSSSGSISTGRITADNTEITGHSGTINIEGLTGKKAIIVNSSGSTTVNGVNDTDLDIRNSSGGIRVEYDSFDNDVNLNCSSGTINLSLPQDSQFGLDASASSGQVNCDFNVENATSDRKMINGTVGNRASNNVTLHSSSGNINIEKR